MELHKCKQILLRFVSTMGDCVAMIVASFLSFERCAMDNIFLCNIIKKAATLKLNFNVAALSFATKNYCSKVFIICITPLVATILVVVTVAAALALPVIFTVAAGASETVSVFAGL
jgi:hypothetical protein